MMTVDVGEEEMQQQHRYSSCLATKAQKQLRKHQQLMKLFIVIL
jgi:hypothetical protein